MVSCDWLEIEQDAKRLHQHHHIFLCHKYFAFGAFEQQENAALAGLHVVMPRSAPQAAAYRHPHASSVSARIPLVLGAFFAVPPVSQNIADIQLGHHRRSSGTFPAAEPPCAARFLSPHARGQAQVSRAQAKRTYRGRRSSSTRGAYRYLLLSDACMLTLSLSVFAVVRLRRS